MLAAAAAESSGTGTALGRFTDRRGGVSVGACESLNLARHTGDDLVAVGENRWRVAAGLGLDPDRVAFLDQVHGADVVVVHGRPAAEVPTADAAVTDVPGVALAVLVADCVPVLLLHPTAVGVVHAGRQGVASGVVGRTVASLEGLGPAPSDIAAWIGPAVCGSCYEVPPDLRDEVAAVVPEAAATTRGGTAALDLPRAVAAQLTAAGVRRVERVGRCTLEDPALFSHRGGDRGRQAGYAWLA